MSRVRSVRASDARWDTWAEAAELANTNLNHWIAESLDLVAERDLADRRRIESEIAERQRLREAALALHPLSLP
jgi:hypothetical protein